MIRKTTNYKPTEQQIIAGLAIKDNNIEFVAGKNRTTLFIQNGVTHHFKEIPGFIYRKLKNAFLKDEACQKAFNTFFPNLIDETKKVALYTYYLWGGTDTNPDVIDGELQPAENFRESEDCISLAFNSKNIHYKGIPLKSRQIKMIDAWSKGILDSVIAEDILDIAQTTYDFHKSKLFKILEVSSKPEAVSVAYKHHILCAL